MPTRFWVSSVIWLAVALAAATTIVRGLTLDTTTLAIVAGEVSLVVAVLGAFDRLLWRIAPVKWVPWPGKPPLLRGTWRMLCTIDGETPSTPPTLCFLAIYQTSSQIIVRTLFPDGRSRSMVGVLTHEYAEHALWFFYDFRPNPDVVQQARIGGAMLSVHPNSLSGRYWNELGERGKLDSTGYSRKIHSEFQYALKDHYELMTHPPGDRSLAENRG